MHKILIVDDDRIIRKGLASTIPWEQYGFELVGEAPDGEQGLELIKSSQPDIVISDIKMPFMDGLTMVRSAKEIYPDMKIILLTGYDDFAYAREAIKIRAFDYLLKPVDKEVLLEKVRKASDELNQQCADKQKICEGMPFFKNKLFKKIVSGKVSQADLLTEAKTLNIGLEGPRYLVFLIKLDDYYTASSLPLEVPAEGMENVKHAVFNICEKLVTEEQKGSVFELERDELAVIYTNDGAENIVRDKARILAECINNAVKQSLGVTVTIALGSVCNSLESAGSSYNEARSGMKSRHFVGKDKVFSLFELGDVDQTQKIQVLELEAELLHQIKLGFAQEALNVVNKIEEDLLQYKSLSLQNIRLISVQLLISLFKGAGEWAQEWEEANRDTMQQYYSQVTGMQTVKEIMDLIRQIVGEVSAFIQGKRESSKCLAIEQAVQYIEENFSKQGLSLHEVAKYIHMNPVYMSALFKQEKNITFSDFLLQARMKKAMELLRRNNMKTYEVAEKVGYSNPEYFSVCFKKYAGMSPLEFRNKA